MDFFDAIILGAIEGVAEFLPISSTAHLILGAKIIGVPDSEFLKSFELMIQLGAILAVVTIYWESFFNAQTLKQMMAGFLPTAVLGLIFYKSIKGFFDDISLILWAVLLGGIFLVLYEWWKRRKGKEGGANKITLYQCALIGLFQAMSFVPGVSRAAATIVGGMMLGISRKTITEYSFLLAVPTFFGAAGLDVIKSSEAVFAREGLVALVVGSIVSYMVAMITIKLFLAYITKKDFMPFGFYRIVVGVAGLLYLI